MSNRHSFAFGLAALVVALVARSGEASTTDVEAWVAGDLTRYVASEMQRLPRFDDAAVRFVVMDNGSPEAAADELSLRLKDRLKRGVLDTPGVRIRWQPGVASRPRLPRSGADCEATEVQYLVGLETRAAGSGDYSVTLRVLDVVENAWVAGFTRGWQGPLTAEQRRASRRRSVDRTFQGSRGVPFGHTETDLVALALARDLRCQLMRQVAGDYVLAASAGESADDPLGRILPLVRNNIAGVSALRFAIEDGHANATLAGRAHAVDSGLHQYWVTLIPTDPDSELVPVSSSVYLRLPARAATGSVAGLPDPIVPLPAVRVLDDVEIVRLAADGNCRTGADRLRAASFARSPADCLGLRVSSREDAAIFILYHQRRFGLVRMGGSSCEDRGSPRIARLEEAVTVALPGEALRSDWQPETAWRLEPGANTYYALAVSDSKAARRLAAHLRKLPARCAETLRVGLTGRELERWLAGLRAAMSRWESAVDWRAVSVSHVY